MAKAKGWKTAACLLWLMEAACQRSQVIGVTHDTLIKYQEVSNTLYDNNPTDDYFLGDSWFRYIPIFLSLKKKLAYRKDLILVIKISHSRYPKKFTKDTTNDWSGGMHMVLEAIVKGVNYLLLLISIVVKNACTLKL